MHRSYFEDFKILQISIEVYRRIFPRGLINSMFAYHPAPESNKILSKYMYIRVSACIKHACEIFIANKRDIMFF